MDGLSKYAARIDRRSMSYSVATTSEPKVVGASVDCA